MGVEGTDGCPPGLTPPYLALAEPWSSVRTVYRMDTNGPNPREAGSHLARPNPTRVNQIRAQAVRRPSRGRTSTVGKIASASLATMTCIGLAGVLAVRAAQDSTAAEATAGSASSADAAQGIAPTTSTGLTQEQLDAYAQQLDDQAQALADYRAQLIDVATQLQAVADSQGVQVRSSGGAARSASGQGTTANGPTKPAKPRPAAQPPVAPAQGQSQGS